MLEKLIRVMDYLKKQEVEIQAPNEYIEKNRKEHDYDIVFNRKTFTLISSMTDGHNGNLFDIKRKNISNTIKDSTIQLFINKLSRELKTEIKRGVDNRLIEQELIKKELDFILE